MLGIEDQDDVLGQFEEAGIAKLRHAQLLVPPPPGPAPAFPTLRREHRLDQSRQIVP